VQLVYSVLFYILCNSRYISSVCCQT